MFSLLPDFTPRDSHSIWYTSSRNPTHQTTHLDGHDHTRNHDHNGGSQGPNGSRRAGQILIERSQLARLRTDEQYLERRRVNVQNFGSTWLKPPGVTKTLHQIREEKREQQEHQEALRREQLAQELAEAEGTGAEPILPDGDMDEAIEEARDLDDDIPDADAADFGMDGVDDEDSSSSEESSSEDEAQREDRRTNLVMAARMRMTDDAFREAIVRGGADGSGLYLPEDELEEDEQGLMLDEEDFVHDEHGDGGMDMDMDADLDDDIPEGESGGYEHTDTEAELSSSEDEEDVSFAPRVAPLGPPQSPTLRARVRPDVPRNSMDLSSLLSGNESSMMESSPQMRGPGSQRR